MTGVAAGVAVVLTVVPSSGRRARRKWSNLVVVWQLGGGEGGEVRKVSRWKSELPCEN